MKYIVNGKEQTFFSRHGRQCAFTHEFVCDVAHKKRGCTVTWRDGDRAGTLAPGEEVIIPNGRIPIFNVMDTSNT